MTKEETEILNNLKTFRNLSSNQKEHSALLREKRIILYAATLLESDNVTILELCLEILENFAANKDAHEFLVSTFGIYEALETLAIRIRDKNEDIHSRVMEITDILRNSAPPAYNTRNRGRGTKPLKRHQLFLLHVEDLNKAFHDILEQGMDRSYLEYPEQQHSPKAKAVASVADLPERVNLLKTVVNLWNQSFYW